MAETQLTIMWPESIGAVLSDMPGALEANRSSRKKCSDYGDRLLGEIADKGMDDSLDQRAAAYIDKARRTVAKMNERRSPFTKLFDTVRSEFTRLENDIDPLKKDTAAWRLQQERNRYAAAKREEEQRRLREEQLRQRREKELSDLRSEIERTVRRQMSDYLKRQCDTLQSAFNYANLDNIDATVTSVREFPTALPEEFGLGLSAGMDRAPAGSTLTLEDCHAALVETRDALLPQFVTDYAQEIGSLKAELLEKFPSKRAQLEKAAKASAEEAAKIKARMEEADRAAAEKREAERLEKEERDRQAAALAAKQAEAANLFNQAAASREAYVPKTKVTKRIEILNPEGILPVISFWFSREGCKLSTEELCKMFKKQITFCEKVANCANPEEIRDESVAYTEEVKAR